jgi:hypothetical protein
MIGTMLAESVSIDGGVILLALVALLVVIGLIVGLVVLAVTTWRRRGGS